MKVGILSNFFCETARVALIDPPLTILIAESDRTAA